MDHLFFPAEIKADDSGYITGRAWQFGVPDRIGDDIEPDAFKNLSLPVPMLAFHDMADPVGSWETATIKSDGLHLAGHLLVNDLPRAREVQALVKAKAIKGLSVGFMTKKAVSRSGGGRTIKSLELFEVSLVTVPMHPGARVTSAKTAVEAIALATALNRAAMALTR